jgi:hypothetical protein
MKGTDGFVQAYNTQIVVEECWQFSRIVQAITVHNSGLRK